MTDVEVKFMLKKYPLYYSLASGSGGADVSGVTATAPDVDEGKIFVDNTGAEVTGTSTYKSDYTALNTLVSGTTATAGDVDSGKLFVKADGTQGTGSSTYKADYTSLNTLVGQTTAVAEDVAQGKVFVNSSGVQTTGTATAGGGNEDLVKMIERPANSEITIPTNTTIVADQSFYGFTGLTAINFGNVSTIGEYGFASCTSLTEITLPTTLLMIKANAFNMCWNLTTVTFLGKPNSIYSSAFSSCSRLTTIRVPWTSGAVSGAPWGATNATIVYNYTP